MKSSMYKGQQIEDSKFAGDSANDLVPRLLSNNKLWQSFPFAT